MMPDLKLHLGCGTKFIPGFVHIDAIATACTDFTSRVEDLSMFEDNSAALIYASHVLEHFGRHTYKSALAEWCRVLAPGGTLRLAVPDFESCARLYMAGGLAEGLPDILGLMMGGQRNSLDFHSMVFDRASLTTALLETGFAGVRSWDWRNTEHSVIDDYSQAYLPHLAKDTGTLVSLNLEATKRIEGTTRAGRMSS